MSPLLFRHKLGNLWRMIKLAGKHGDKAAVERLLPMLRLTKQRPGTFRWRGASLQYADAPSTYYQLAEIFVGVVYDFIPEPGSPPPLILDVGGNIGLACLRFRELHPDAEIVTFEPDPALAKILRSNLRSCGDEQSKVVEAAAWTHNGEVSFAARGDDSGSIQGDGCLRVSSVDLADYLDRPVDFLKLDIEGAEFDVLNHLLKTGAMQNVQRIFIELHHWNGAALPRFNEVFSVLAAAGLNYRILETKVTPNPADWSTLPASSNMIGVAAWRPKR